MGEEANCNTVMEAAKAKENGHAVPDVKAKADDDATVVVADPRLQGISDAIRVVPHFPKPGTYIHTPIR